ncbi:hypothetical protein CISG_01922 [Coccidioides immitis RMSCC 3703]|nr:hypothetical protein CISG_01922 [Coccidioides immitis RMSCC 3703]
MSADDDQEVGRWPSFEGRNRWPSDASHQDLGRRLNGNGFRWAEEFDDEIHIAETPRATEEVQSEKFEDILVNGVRGDGTFDDAPYNAIDEPNLDNPFALFESVETLDEGVECFASQHGLLSEVDGVKRAARFERDDMEAFGDPDFPEEEKIALQDERKATFWQQTRSLRSAVLIIGGLSGVCQGWTQSTLNGTNIPLGEAFHLDVAPGSSNTRDQFLLGALSASVTLASGILGLLIADPIQNHWLGRRGAVAISAAISMGATIGAVCSRTPAELIGCRMLIGAALGAKASVIAPFLAELAPVHMRGALLSTWQVSDALGIFLGDVSWKVVDSFNLEPDTAWRFLSATTLIPTIPLMISSYMIPESWMFLMKTGEYSKATEAACLYRKYPIQGFRDIISSHFQMEAEGELMEIRKVAKKGESKGKCSDEESKPAPGRNVFADETKPLSERLAHFPPGLCLRSQRGQNNEICTHSYHMKEAHFFRRLAQIIQDPRCRHALVSGGTIMLTQSLCGINALAFFSSSLLDAGISPEYSLILALCFGAVCFSFGLLTPLLSDRLGRTNLVLLGLPVMAVFMFILASLFELDNSARTPTIMLFTMLFTAVYAFTVGPAAFSLSAESFPSTVREAGMAMCVFINLTSLGIQLLMYPFITTPIGFTTSLSIYGCVNIVGFVACFLFCVDTRDRTLEQLQFSFDLPLSVHCEYRIFYVLPEVCRRCRIFVARRIRRKEGEAEAGDGESIGSDGGTKWELIPFYRWARIQDPNRPSVYAQLLSVVHRMLPTKARQWMKVEKVADRSDPVALDSQYTVGQGTREF